MNVVVLIGTLSRDPEHRDLPSGDTVTTFDLTTRHDDEPGVSVPIAWFPPAVAGSGAELVAGDHVVITGEVRRRFFRANGLTQSRTEVVAERVVKVRQAKRSRAALDRALVRLADQLPEELAS